MSGRGGGVSMSQTRYEGLQDLPALKYKPGAPFKHWKKPPALAALEKPLSACADALRPGAGNASLSLTATTPAHPPLRCFRATPAAPPTGDCRSDHQALLPAGQAPVA